jgi:hypothetical protein
MTSRLHAQRVMKRFIDRHISPGEKRPIRLDQP